MATETISYWRQVRHGTSPEVFYSTLPPEAIHAVEKSPDLVPANAKARKWTKWGLAILGLMFVAALAIGLTVGLRKKNRCVIRRWLLLLLTK